MVFDYVSVISMSPTTTAPGHVEIGFGLGQVHRPYLAVLSYLAR